MSGKLSMILTSTLLSRLPACFLLARICVVFVWLVGGMGR